MDGSLNTEHRAEHRATYTLSFAAKAAQTTRAASVAKSTKLRPLQARLPNARAQRRYLSRIVSASFMLAPPCRAAPAMTYASPHATLVSPTSITDRCDMLERRVLACQKHLVLSYG
eukprot:701558-Rhodomonas_salina.2